MHLPRFEYVRPRNLSEGLQALADNGADAAIMSGGTDLLLNMKYRLNVPKVLVSLNGLEELQNIEALDDGSLRIGSGCSLTRLARDPLINERYPALRDAIYSVGSRHVRNMATLGGNICLDTRCWYTNQSETWRCSREGCFKTDAEICHVIKSAARCHAINSSDTAPALIALGANVTLASHAGERRVPLREFYRDDGVEHTVRGQHEVLVDVIVPAASGRTVFAKLAQRTGLDFAAGSFAAHADGTAATPTSVDLVMGAVASMPRILTGTAQALEHAGLTDESIEQAAASARQEFGEITNLFTPAGYKRRLIRALIRDALLDLREQLNESRADP